MDHLAGDLPYGVESKLDGRFDERQGSGDHGRTLRWCPRGTLDRIKVVTRPRLRPQTRPSDVGESMIEILPGLPEGVTGIRVSGRLRGDDLREFKPAMEDLLKSGEIRIVEVIAPDYEGFGPGGLIEDLKLGLGALIQHHSAFKRIAVVSDKDWVVHALHAFAWMVPGELALFGLDELERAKEWAAG